MKISPSILDANFQNLQKEIDSIAAADRIHLDIMDGNFVPNLSFGPPVFRKIKFPISIEAHLMVKNPELFFEDFLKFEKIFGITFHAEIFPEKKILEILHFLKLKKICAGICFDADTKLENFSEKIFAAAEKILLMSVRAGFGGQKFRPEVFEKIKFLRQKNFKKEIEIDGGVNLENAPKLKKAGADIAVVGSFLMKKNPTDREKIIREFQKINFKN